MSIVSMGTIQLGDRVRLEGRKYRVRAVSPNFACLTIGTPQGRQYTVIDWRNQRRGACNLIGWGYGDGTYTESECARMLAQFEAGELELSHRNNVPLEEVHLLLKGLPIAGGDA